MISYGGGTNQYKVWDLVREDVVVSRDVVFIEGKPVDQTPATYVEEPGIMYDSITGLPGTPAETQKPQQQLPTPPQSECQDMEEPVQEPEIEPEDPGILLQETTMEDEPQESATGGSTSKAQRTSGRKTKGTITSKKFTDKDFNKKPGQIRMAKMTGNMDPNNEEEPTTVKEALNHPGRGKQWEKAIRSKIDSHLKNHT